MQVEILERDAVAGTAKIRFTHGGVTHTQSYDLKLVVPGTALTLETYGLQFTEAMQQTVIEKLTAQIQREIDAGIICNPV